MAGSTGGRSSRSKAAAGQDEQSGAAIEQDATLDGGAGGADDTGSAETSAVEPLGGSVVSTGVPAGGVDPDAADERAATRGGSPTYYLNMTNGPLVYNADGQSVDGSSWTPEPIVLDTIGQQQRDRGNLLPKSAL